MISDAVGRGQVQQKINQSKITDLMDIRYKNALIQQMSDRTRIGEVNSAKALRDAMRESPFNVPGKGRVSLDEWKALDSKTKAFSYYAFNAKSNGEEVMKYNEWDKQTSDPVKKQLFDLTKEDPEFAQFLKDNPGGTTINIGEQVDKASALADVKADKYLTSPTGLPKDIDKHINSEDVQNKLMVGGGFSDPKIAKTIIEKETRSYIERQIKATQGEILESGYDGTDMVWVVKTKSGETITIRRPR